MYGLIPFSRRNMLRDFNDVNDLFDQFFNASFMFPVVDPRMKCDIKEQDKHYVMDIDLPGVNKEDIEVRLEDGYLTVAVKKEESKEENKEGNVTYIVKERRYEGCQRSFKVSDQVTKDDINAKFEDGVLTLTIDKKEDEPKDTKINVN